MNRKTARGFTLMEIIIVIALLAIIMTVAVIILDPVDLIRGSRDSNRISDLSSLQKAINLITQDSPLLSKDILCNGEDYPCGGRSSDTSYNARSIYGDGWIKINLSTQKGVIIPTLPQDPLNTDLYHYVYCANNPGNKDGWEIDAVLESKQGVLRMQGDGGSDNNKYEVGTNLNLVGSAPCNY